MNKLGLGFGFSVPWG